MNWLDFDSEEFANLYQKLRPLAEQAAKAVNENPVTSENAQEWAENLIKSTYS